MKLTIEYYNMVICIVYMQVYNKILGSILIVVDSYFHYWPVGKTCIYKNDRKK